MLRNLINHIRKNKINITYIQGSYLVLLIFLSMAIFRLIKKQNSEDISVSTPADQITPIVERVKRPSIFQSILPNYLRRRLGAPELYNKPKPPRREDKDMESYMILCI